MGRIGWDDLDCAYDVRLARLLKKRRFDIREFEINTCSQTLKRTLEKQQLGDGMVDEDYKTFLIHLGEYSESRHSVREDSNDSDDSYEEDDVDPQYKMFLENLREDGKSYVLDVISNEVSLSIKYEAESGSDYEHEPPTREKSRKVPNTGKLDAAKYLRNLLGEAKRKTEKNLRNFVSKGKKDSTKNMRNARRRERRNLVAEKDLKSEPVNHVSAKTDGCASKKPSPKGNHSFEVESEHEMGTDVVDDCYQTFLNSIKVEGDCMVFTTEDGKKVKYEGLDVESSSDSEILVTCNASDFDEGNYNPFTTSKLFDSFMEEDEQHCLGGPGASDHSGFRKKLMSKLREPYDHEEYEKLLRDIKQQRPKEGRHDLRGTGALKSYSKDEYSPSYLEKYSDLKRMVCADPVDKRKVLNLLRGFFFWLQNLVHEDAFLPWRDRSCLEVMPRDR